MEHLGERRNDWLFLPFDGGAEGVDARLKTALDDRVDGSNHGWAEGTLDEWFNHELGAVSGNRLTPSRGDDCSATDRCRCIGRS
jgi:hypothetical protein